MDYLQLAKETVEQSQGDVRDADHRDRLTTLAQTYATIAQAEATAKLADTLHKLIHGGEPGGYFPVKVYDA